MIIQVNDNYRIVSQDMGWKIEWLHTKGKTAKNPGEQFWDSEGTNNYGEQFDQVLRGMYNILLNENEDTVNVSNAIKLQLLIYEEIKEIGKKCYKASDVHKGER